VSVQVNPLGTATAALKRLVVQREIASFTTNFEQRREAGFIPHVAVAITGQDELSIERAKRRVQAEIRPLLGRVVLTVQPKGANHERR
jgi:hypothetical protein